MHCTARAHRPGIYERSAAASTPRRLYCGLACAPVVFVLGQANHPCHPIRTPGFGSLALLRGSCVDTSEEQWPEAIAVGGCARGAASRPLCSGMWPVLYFGPIIMRPILVGCPGQCECARNKLPVCYLLHILVQHALALLALLGSLVHMMFGRELIHRLASLRLPMACLGCD